MYYLFLIKCSSNLHDSYSYSEIIVYIACSGSMHVWLNDELKLLGRSYDFKNCLLSAYPLHMFDGCILLRKQLLSIM